MKTKALMLASDDIVDWDRFEQMIHGRFQVNATAYDGYGRRRTTSRLWANGLCRLIKSHLKARKLICDTLQQAMISRARVTRRYVTDECSAGIYRRLFPILRDLRVNGFLGICGRPFSTRRLMYPDYIHKITGVGNAEIENLISGVAPISPKKILEMTDFIIEEGLPLCSCRQPEAQAG